MAFKLDRLPNAGPAEGQKGNLPPILQCLNIEFKLITKYNKYIQIFGIGEKIAKSLSDGTGGQSRCMELRRLSICAVYLGQFAACW